MKTHRECDRSFQFTFPKLDTLVQVEEQDDIVVIRASRDSFSERRKLSFIRELAAEGFIADCFQWSRRGVRWLVDASLAKPRQDIAEHTNHFMFRLWWCAVLLWVALMAVAVLHGRPSP